MADLLTGAPEAPSANPMDVLVPGSGNAVSTLKPIDPNAKLKLAARDKAADPFAGLEPVSASDPFSGLEEVGSPTKQDAFSGLQAADDLDLKDTQTLVDDDNFRPADYFAANPNLRTDAEKSKKLIDVYRARQVRGLEAGKVLKAAVTEAPGIVAKTAKGLRDLGARIIEVGIQPAATSALATLTGASAEEKAAIMAEQGKEQLKAVGEVTAGTEAAVTGLAQLGQQGMRKLFSKSPSEMSDSELLDQLYLDSEFSKTTKEVAEGRGDVVKAAGLDADTLAKNGVTLDKEAIEHLSLVDPLTLVATAGAFKVVGLGGKVIATAATKAGAQTVINGLAKVAQTVGAKGIQVAGQTAETIGKVGVSVAEKLPAKSVGFVLGATKTGTLQGGAIGAAAGEAAKRIGVESSVALGKQGARVAELGTQLSPSFIGPRSAGLTRVLSLPSTPVGQIATRAAGGAVQGVVTALPLVAAADESQTAGALLGGGAALGALHGAAVGTKSVIAETVAKNYLDPHNIPFDTTKSPAYGMDANLDATHDAAIAKLPESEQNAINTFREGVRAGGGEIYVQDSSAYLNRIRENIQNEKGGQPLTPEQEAQATLYANTHAFFDGWLADSKGESRRVVFLNSDAKGLPHDAGHLFQSLLSPENQASLRDSALSSYSKEQLQAFKEEYAKRIGEPDYFTKLGEEAGNAKAADELIAENFGQLFQNKTFADLSAPRPFLKKLGDVAVQAGEALGLDLTAGRTTADLGAKPYFRLQDLLRNAAQDVLTRKDSKKLTPAEVKPVEEVKPASVTPESVKPVEPSSVKPIEVEPRTTVPEAEKLPTISDETKNIRTTRPEQTDFASRRAEETGVAEAQKATESNPEARRVVDTIADSMQKGNLVLEVEHRGIVSERGPASPEGRTSRRGTQEQGYQELDRLQIENRAEAPADIVDLHQKTFVPVRFTTQGGKPTLIAMSLDKVIANVRRVVKDAVANKAESLLPYPVENGKLTDAGWKQAIADVQAYSENQSNGYRGDGTKLTRPTEDIGVSIPAENPNYTPKGISEGAMNFANLVQGLAPPETGRVQKGLTPGNVKGQLLAEVNKKQPMTPAVIKPENVTKQKFKGFEPRTVKETNPLRNELAARGVKVRELTEVTERLAVEDIASVKPREDIAFKAPVTDTIRAGFLPRDVREFNRLPSSEQEAMVNRMFAYGQQGPGKGVQPVGSSAMLKRVGETLTKEILEPYDWVRANGKTVIRENARQLPKGNTVRDTDVPFADDNFLTAVKELFGVKENLDRPLRAGFLPGGETDRAIRSGFLPDNKPSEPSPSVEIRSLASNYAKTAGVDYKPSRTYSGVDAELGKQLADFYDSMKSSPEDPAVQASYQALTNETLSQYQAIKDAGYTIEPFKGEGEPYKNSAEAVADIRENKHLFFLQTDKVFGTGAESSTNPMLNDSGVVIGGDRLLVNDVFRAMHDFFGHGKEGYQFGPRGEFNAWRAHSEMFSPQAQGALAAETLAQNSWVNFGKHLRDANGNLPQRGEPGYVELANRPFGEQKNVIVPEEMINRAREVAGREPKFLPDGKTVEEFGREIIGLSPDDWKKATQSWDGGLTAEAYRLGLGLKDVADVKRLADLRDQASAEFREKMAAGDLDGAYPSSTKSQFFAEAYGAATDTGSAANPRMGWRRANPDGKPPFPKGGDGAKFLPRTEAGKKVAKEGIDFEMTGGIGNRAILIKRGGARVGHVVSSSSMFTGDLSKAIIAGADVKKSFQGKGIGEAAYRELLTQLKEDGVTEVGGMTVSGAPLAIREKIFGKGSTKIKDVMESDRGTIPVDQAISELNAGGLGFEATNTITPESKFLPAESGKNLKGGFYEVVPSLGAQDNPVRIFMSDGATGKQLIAKFTKAQGGTWSEYRKKFIHVRGPYTEQELGPRPDDIQFLPKKRGVSEEDIVPKKKKETVAEKMAREIEATDFSKYNTPEEFTPSGNQSTGWVLPDGKFVPIDDAYHQEWLAKNSGKLNTDFGTKLSKTASVEERLDALNAGFVRVRDNRGANTVVEVNSRFWKGKTKATIEDLLLNPPKDVFPDRFTLTLLDNEGNTVDSVSARLFDSESPARDVVEDALGQLSVVTVERKKTGPSDIQRARAMGQSFDPQFLPGDGAEEYTVVWKPREAGKTTFRKTVMATSIDDAKAQVIPKGGHFVEAFTEESVNQAAQKITPDMIRGLEDRARREAGGAKFLPKGETPEFNEYVSERIRESKQHPEALPLDFRKDENGNYVAGFNGEPTMVARDYALLDTPLAKKSAGKTASATEEKFSAALAKGLEREYAKAVKNPEVKAGETWYSTCRKKLQTLLGDDTKLFAELLGATSPQTAVDVNFGFALEAYNRFKKGAYDTMLEKYREGKAAFANGELEQFSKETGKIEKKATHDAFMNWWVDKHNLIPTQGSGKRFGMNSKQVLRVLDGSWLQNVKGPKTPNFTGNLTGSTFEATIDVWAMRTLHRLANEGNAKRWRIQPGNETGVTKADFFLGQKAFRKAAEKLGIQPDALQAILWFNEKEYWTQKGWAKSLAKKKSDFNVLLADTERTPEGRLARIDKQLSLMDIEPKKK